MGQENASRFSHITVGHQDVDGSSQPEEEEVIAIGAVDVGLTPPLTTDAKASGHDQSVDARVSDDARASAVAEGQDTSLSEAKEPLGLSVEQPTERPVKQRAEQTAEDLGLDTPMLLAQKLVIGASFIGLIVAIVFLVWFWTTQQ
jgi:hypothetical protein